MKTMKTIAAAGLLAAFVLGAAAQDTPPRPELQRPDGRPAAPAKKAKVFILLGQSNMVGMGNVTGAKGETLENAVRNEKLYPYLLDGSGGWAERTDVRYVQVMVGQGGGMNVLHNEWLKVGKGKIGVEYGFGHQVGDALEEPVLLLKSCIGNRALGWDLLPPGSEGFEYTTKDRKTGQETTYVHPGYKGSPERWEKGTTPQPIAWYAGKQYDDDVANAKKVLAEFATYHPGVDGYEVAGFLWWQGERDCGSDALSSRYEQNLVAVIKALRRDFNAPDAKFVIATLGEAAKGGGGNTETVLNAMMAVDGKSGKYPEFKGNVATVYTHDMARGGSGNGHYGGNAKVYMDVGEAMGKAMLELLGRPAAPRNGAR
jgi:hypothetical protein